MKPWEIWSYQPEGWPQPHPAVIVSSAARVANKPDVNLIMCASQEARRPPTELEVILDEADGLDRPTLCKCDLLHLVKKDVLKNRRGRVSAERRREILRTMSRVNEWL
jgi:mRNA-degrading endonuclease toxin of MazEF toxin-antitoxin module